MSSFNKLVEKFIYEQDKIDIDDVRGLLDHLGYTEKRKPGSECTFHKKGAYPFNVPTVKGKQVKKCYVKRMVKILGLEEYLDRTRRD